MTTHRVHQLTPVPAAPTRLSEPPRTSSGRIHSTVIKALDGQREAVKHCLEALDKLTKLAKAG